MEWLIKKVTEFAASALEWLGFKGDFVVDVGKAIKWSLILTQTWPYQVKKIISSELDLPKCLQIGSNKFLNLLWKQLILQTAQTASTFPSQMAILQPIQNSILKKLLKRHKNVNKKVPQHSFIIIIGCYHYHRPRKKRLEKIRRKKELEEATRKSLLYP